MLQTSKVKAPVKAVLRVGMVIPGGDRGEKGDVVEFPAKDFFYLKQFDRVAEATEENIKQVLGEVKAAEDHAERLAKEAAADSPETLKALLAAAQAEITALKAKK